MGQKLEWHGIVIEDKGGKSFTKDEGNHQCQVLQKSSRMKIWKKPLNLVIRRLLVSFERYFRWSNGSSDGSSQIMID